MNILTDIDEGEMLSSLERSIDQADSYTESMIGAQRDKGHRYYYGEPLGNERPGRSQHVSMDVFDAVESVKSMLMETFTADRNICRFDPQTPQDFVNAKLATELTNFIFYRDNNGSKIIHDVIHDALIAKTGIVKRYYKSHYEYDEEEFENVDANAFAMLGQDPAVTIMEIEEQSTMAQVQDPQTGQMVEMAQTSYSGTLARKIDKSKICIEVLQPEDFLITPTATSETDADFASHRSTRTRGELMSEGYPEELIKKLDDEHGQHEDGGLGRDSIDDFSRSNRTDADYDQQHVTIYESYTRKYRDDLRKCVYLKVLHSRKVLLDMEIVSEMPFRYWTPFPLAHRFHGMSLADVLCDIQMTQSSLKRGVVDHTFMSNTSRFVANLSLVKNARDLLDNKPGAVIDVNSPNPENVVRPLPLPNLSGTVFQAIENLEVEKEARSGMSRMSRGMDSTVVSKQNSSDLITQFMNASNRRIMVMARHMANNFIRPLMHDLYKLAMEYETDEKMLMLDGNFVRIDPKMLGHREHMTVATALTPEEQAQEAQVLLSLDQQFTMNPQDPNLGGLYTQPQRHAMLSRAFELLNIKNAGAFLFDPSSPEFQQQQQQQQQQQEEAAAKQSEVEKFNAGMTARQVAVLEGQLELDVVKEQNNMVVKMEEMQHSQESVETRILLDTEKQSHDMKMSEKELTLEAKQKRNVSIG